MNVFVASIKTLHGTTFYAASTEALLVTEIYEYVKRNWEAEDVPDDLGKLDKEDAISAYFQLVDEEVLTMGNATEVRTA